MIRDSKLGEFITNNLFQKRYKDEKDEDIKLKEMERQDDRE